MNALGSVEQKYYGTWRRITEGWRIVVTGREPPENRFEFLRPWTFSRSLNGHCLSSIRPFL